MDQFIQTLTGLQLPELFIFIVRFVLPFLAAALLLRCAVSLLGWKKEPELWGYLELPNGVRLPINHWENTIGRATSSDICLNYPSVSRSHAVLTRRDDGSWCLYDLGSKYGSLVNGTSSAEASQAEYGDVLNFGGVETVLMPVSEDERSEEQRTKPGKHIWPGINFLLLTLFQLITAFSLCITAGTGLDISVPLSFLYLSGAMWLYFIVIRLMGKRGFEIETIAFFLSTLSLAVTASKAPEGIYTQLYSILIGVTIFICLGWFLRDLNRAKKARWLMAGGALALFAFNLLFGSTINGSKNWILIGSFSLQPSEIIKIAFIYAGASTLDRLLTKRNLTLFILFTGACVGALALMGDFGTAATFFAAFVVIAFIRSGELSTIALSCSGAAFAAFIAFKFKPYILNRFEAWGKVWEYINTTGYQQTRTMMCIAAGGLFGLGPGNGWLKYVDASETDLVFGFIAEEWGLIIAVFAVLSIICLTVFTFKSASVARSSFYVIAAGAAVSMFMVQTILNVFGSVDLLPLTGVTFPFLSKGGSSMISSWGLLAFIKAIDTRRSSSFATKRVNNRYAVKYAIEEDSDGDTEDDAAEDYEDYQEWS